MSEKWPDPDNLTRMAVDCEVLDETPEIHILILDCWGRVHLWNEGQITPWSSKGLPGIPENPAVGLAILPWEKTVAILAADGWVYHLPLIESMTGELTSWPAPENPPRKMVNLLFDDTGCPYHPGASAVDLLSDATHQQLLVLDTTGRITNSTSTSNTRERVDFNIRDPESFVQVAAALNSTGTRCYICNYFGNVFAWPGKWSDIEVFLGFNWQAVADMKLLDDKELYVLDVQGGIHSWTRDGTPASIDMAAMVHYSPDGTRQKSYPYVVYSMQLYHKLEIAPEKRSVYRMTWNFTIHPSREKMTVE
jgi:hypothetical protein